MDSNQSLAHAKRDCACHAVRVPKHRGKVLYGGCGMEAKEAPARPVAAKGGLGIAEGSACRDRMTQKPLRFWPRARKQ